MYPIVSSYIFEVVKVRVCYEFIEKGGECMVKKQMPKKRPTKPKCPVCGGGCFYYSRVRQCSHCMKCGAHLDVNWKTNVAKETKRKVKQ